MIASAIINRLSTDATLTSILSTYNGSPAIFVGFAPENAAFKYLVITMTNPEPSEDGVQDFNVNIAYFDFNGSRASMITVAERIEFLLDDWIMQNSRYLDIHFYYSGGGQIPGTDPRDMHYNQQFMAQGIRSKWIAETK